METPLANTKHERFASIIAFGKGTQAEAFVQAGYSERGAAQSAQKLLRNGLVSSRIEFLRARQAAAVQATAQITRERIAQELSAIAFNGHAPMIRMRAIELLVKLQGYAEPSRTEVSHMHLHIDSGLAAQLREGYAQLSSTNKAQAIDVKHDECAAKPITSYNDSNVYLPNALSIKEQDTPQHPPPPVPPPSKEHTGAHPTPSHTQAGGEEGASEIL